MQEALRQVGDTTGFVMRERQVATTNGNARISFLVFEPMERAGFINAFSTRNGGTSSLPSGALNLGQGNNDDNENVAENRRRFLKAIGLEGTPLVTARQTHSTDRCLIETPEQAHGFQPDCDALTTKVTGILLGIQTADCLPVLIADPKSGAMAAVHAGWRGTAGRITERAVADLMLRHGANPRDCIAALGPAACGECYEVGDDVISRYKKEFGYWRALFSNFNKDGKAYLDVRAANVQQLKFCGLIEDRIHVTDYCTMHHSQFFFSHRREGTASAVGTGRMLSVIGKAGLGENQT